MRLLVATQNYLVKLQMYNVVRPRDCQSLHFTEKILQAKVIVEKMNSAQRTDLERHFSVLNILKRKAKQSRNGRRKDLIDVYDYGL